MTTRVGTLEELYVVELRDLLHAETELVKFLPEMVSDAQSPRLSQALERHLDRSIQHVQRLENILGRLRQDSHDPPCKAMEGLLEASRGRMRDDATSIVRDSALLATAQKARHYEIAGYRNLCTFAQILNRPRDLTLLGQTLQEEIAADRELAEIAQDTAILSSGPK